jgi:peroxiredoxin Q/BCP
MRQKSYLLPRFSSFLFPLSAQFLPVMNQPQVGDKAPSFNAPVVGGSYKSGDTLNLADLTGETFVLYFYPKDDTPGCTVQACALRDGWAKISDKAKIFGISINHIKSHEKFIQKFDLPFPIIADEDHQIAEAYGVWVEKSMYGKKYLGHRENDFRRGA